VSPAGTPLRVLHIASGDLWAGAEVQLFYLCRQLFKQGIDVRVVLFNPGILAQRLTHEGVTVTILDESTCSGAQLLRKLMRHLRETKPTLIHTHGHKENVLAGLANRLTEKAAALRTAHGASEINEPLWKIHKHIFQWLDRFAGRHWQQAIVAVSNQLAMVLAKTFAIEKIHVIENAIDIEYVKAMAALPLTLDLEAQGSKLAIVGRLVPVKRQDLLLKALSLLRESKLHLYVIGDGPLAAQLITLANDLNVSDRVTFTGALDPVHPMLAQMDLLIMPSDHEGLPMTLLEAMVLKVPIVAHGVGGITKVTRDGELATLVHVHTEQGYAEAIAKSLLDADAMRIRSEAAAEYVKREYDISRKYLDYLDLYNELLRKQGSAAA